MRPFAVKMGDWMPKPAAVVFDMDGTLVDTERVSQASWRRASSDLGHPLPEWMLDAFVGCSMPDARAMVDREFRDAGLTDRLFAHQRELFARLEEEGLELRPGAFEAVRGLAGAGIALALATSTERGRASRLMDRFGLAGYFTKTVFGDEVSHAKPDPEIYLVAADRLGMPPSSCVAVEDSVNGARAAIAAGMRTYMVPEWSAPTKDVLASCEGVLRSLAELPGKLLGDGLR